MKAVLFKVKPGDRFHFGKYKPDVNTGLENSDEIFHSDSLFSALVVTYDSLFDNTDEFVNLFRKGLIKISSLFYYLEFSDYRIFFLPKPVTLNLTASGDHKKAKKIRYLSKKLYETLENPDQLLSDKVLILQDTFALLKDELPVKNAEDVHLFHSIVDQKVFVNKEEQGDDLYQLNVIEIADNSMIDNDIKTGFYFLFKMYDRISSAMKSAFETVLEVLTTNGLGAEKSTIGLIRNWEKENFDFKITDPSDTQYLSLSVFYPSETETEHILAAKDILRGGRVIGGTNKRLKVVRMLTEGSLFDKKITGNIIGIEPDNWNGIPYLRFGKAFLIPLNKNFEI